MLQLRGQKIKRGQVTKMAALYREGQPKPWTENLGVKCGVCHPYAVVGRNWDQVCLGMLIKGTLAICPKV